VFERDVFGQHLDYKVWLAKDFPEAEHVRAIQEAFAKGNPYAQMGSNMLPANLPKDLIVRFEVGMPRGGQTISEVTSIKFAIVEDSKFVLPKEYKLQKMPNTPAGP